MVAKARLESPTAKAEALARVSAEAKVDNPMPAYDPDRDYTEFVDRARPELRHQVAAMLDPGPFLDLFSQYDRMVRHALSLGASKAFITTEAEVVEIVMRKLEVLYTECGPMLEQLAADLTADPHGRQIARRNVHGVPNGRL